MFKKACLLLPCLFTIVLAANVIFEPPDQRLTNNSTYEYPYYGNGRNHVYDDQGRIHLIWHYSNTIYYKRYTPGFGWSADTSLGTGGNYAAMAIDPTGRIHVCAYYSTYYIYYKSCMPVGTGNAGWDASWTVLGTSSDGYKYYPSIAATPDTHVHIAFYRYRNVTPYGYMLGYYEKIGSTWQSLVTLDSSSTTEGYYYHYYPCIAGGKANNDIHITWYGRRADSPTYYEIYYLSRTGTTWDTVENVSQSGTYYQYMPTIDVNYRNGYPYIVWSGGPTYPYRKIVKYRTSSGWSAADTISEPGSSYYQYYGQITSMKDGSMHNVWYGYCTESPSYYQIRYVGSDTLGTTWGSIQNIRDDGNYYTYYPEIACSDSLEAFVFWYDGRNSPYELYYRVGRAPKPNDVGVTNISVFPPYTVVQGDSAPVTITIKNFGMNTQTSIPVAYQVSAGTPVTATWTGSLAGGDTVRYTFSTPWVPSSAGSVPIKAWTALSTEQWPSNDTCNFLADVFIIGTRVGQLINGSVFPPPGWQTNIIVGTMDWQQAASSSYPSGYYPLEGAGMARFYSYGAYPPSEARLWTHKFNVGDSAYDLIVDWWMLHTSSYGSYYDSCYVEYSFDSTNWVTVDGYRCYNSTNPGWVKHTDTLGSFPAYLDMWVGFRAVSDWYHDIHIDSLRTYIATVTAPLNDVGADSIAEFPRPMVVGDTYPVTIQIRNYAVGAQNFIPVYYDPGDGSGAVHDTFIGLLPAPPNPATVLFTFSTPYIPASQGAYTMKAWTALPGDIDLSNDTTTLAITVCPLFHTTPFTKDFEEAWGTYGDVPPFCGWRIAYDGTPSTNDWYKATGWWPSHGTDFAGMTSSPGEDPSYDSLISPRFNFTGEAGVTMSCSTYWNPYDTAYLAQIKGSIDDGATWPYTIRTYPQTGVTENLYETFTLPWAADQGFVRIAWIGVGNTNDIDYWAVDDILITSGPMTPDVGAYAILNPIPGGGVPPGDSLQPQATIMNYGNVPRAFNATFRISGPVSYANTQPVAMLAPGDSVDITFNFTSPLTAGYYTMSCSTELSDDSDNSNDKLASDFMAMLAPTLITPANGSLINDDTPYFDWTDVTGATEYECELDTLADFSTAISANPTVSEWTPTVAVVDGHYYWRARGGASGAFGLWSAVWEFDLDATAPASPVLIEPPNGATDVVLNPTFIWSSVVFFSKNPFSAKPEETDHPANTYYIQLSMQSDFSTTVFEQSVAETTLASPVNLQGSMKYYWHVAAVDEANNYSAYSSTFEFTTVSSGQPDRWVQMTSITFGDKPIYKGGCLAYFPDSGWVYGLKGNSRPTFGHYSIAANTWTQDPDMPFSSDGKKKKPKLGAAMLYTELSPSNKGLYMTKGGNRNEWWRYGLPGDSTPGWRQLADVPTGAKRCKGGTILANLMLGDPPVKYILLIRGSKTSDGYLYNLETGMWTGALPGVPLFDKKTAGVGINDSTVLAVCYDRGSKTNPVYLANLNANTWTKKTEIPLYGSTGRKKKVKEGVAAAYDGTKAYMFKGGNTKEFFDYIVDDSLNERAPIPITTKKGIKAGGSLVYAEGFVWAFPGTKLNEFWQYCPVAPPPVALAQPAPSVNEGTMGKKVNLGEFKLTIAPNPAINLTAINYNLPVSASVNFKLYNVTGAVVKSYTSSVATKEGVLMLDTKALPSGVYILRFNAGDIRVTRKLILEK